MRLKLVIVLSLFIFAYSAAASSASEVPEIPINYLFDGSSYIQVRNICHNSVGWFRQYFAKIRASGRDLNSTLRDGNTLLHLAVKESCPFMVQALLEAEADVYKTNPDNESALQLASYLFTHGQGFEAVWDVFAAAGFELIEEDDGENDASADATGQDDEHDTSMDVHEESKEDESSISINSSLGFLEFDPDEVVKILNEIPETPLPIPSRYLPFISIQVLGDKPVEVGEKYLRI